jgi:adenylate cyclase
LSPSFAFALFMGSHVQAYAGNAELAIEWAERALRVSPIDALAYIPRHALAMGHFLQARYEEAADAARRAVQSNPNFSVSHSLLAACLAKLGQMQAAKGEANQVLVLQPSFSSQGFCAAVAIAPALAEPLLDAWHKVGLPP